MGRAAWHRRWVLIGAVMAVSGLGGVVVAGCASESTTSEESATSAEQTSAAADHLEELAQGETPGIASQLVEVDGYSYEDVEDDEVAAIHEYLTAIEDEIGVAEFFRAVSLHSIVSEDEDQNTARRADGAYETGFLQLLEYSEPPPVGVEPARTSVSDDDPIDSFTVGDIDVFVFEDPESPDSRFTLAWDRHGVTGSLDGADRAPLERWVRRYLELPERQPNESSTLSDQLHRVPGYAYVNYWDDSTNDLLVELLSGRAASAHAVVDRDGAIGGLWLIEVGAEITSEDLEAVANEIAPGAPTEAVELGQGEAVRVELETGETMYLSVQDQVLAVVVTTVDDLARPFLTDYLEG